jgi:hypothetical protein
MRNVLKWFLIVLVVLVATVLGFVAGLAPLLFIYEGTALWEVAFYELLLPVVVGGGVAWGLAALLRRGKFVGRPYVLAIVTAVLSPAVLKLFRTQIVPIILPMFL